jgi:hypothetical protein
MRRKLRRAFTGQYGAQPERELPAAISLARPLAKQESAIEALEDLQLLQVGC